MITVRIPQTPSSTLETAADTIDRDDRLQLEQWVLGEHGKSLGTLDELRRDPATGHVSGIIVRREIVSQRRLVPVNLVTAVTPRSVQIQMTRVAFKRLPQLST